MLDGRYALILGGDTDVGRAVARLFAAHGARVAVASEASPSGAAPKPDIPDILTFETPMAPSAMEPLCTAVLQSFPYVDLLVSATDLYKTGATRNFSTLDLRRMLDVNLGCAVKCFQRLLTGMLGQRRGEVILFAPDLADAGLPGAAAAAACAGAIAAFARNVTNDYIRYRVRANTVLYPYVGICGRAPLSGGAPLSGALEPEDAANAALWYSCYMSRFVTGEKLELNGGLAYVNTVSDAGRCKPGII